MTEQAPSAEMRKFAPKQKQEAHPTDRVGEALVTMLKEAANVSNQNERLVQFSHDLSRQLQAAHDRIDQLQGDVEHYRGRAASAEKWLELIEKEIEQTLITPIVDRWREQAPIQ